MNVTKTAGLALVLIAALTFLAAIPANSAGLVSEKTTSLENHGASSLILPTAIPTDLLDDDDDDVEANDDFVTTLENTPVTIDVLANDEGVDGEDASLSIDEEPENGSATVQSDLKIQYIPEAGFTGEDEFEYEVCSEGDDDDDGAGVNDDDDDDEECDKADVFITVEAAPVTNEQPVAVDDTFTVGQETLLSASTPGVLANDFDPNDDPLSADLVSGVKNGSLVLNANGSFTYTPADGFVGVDTFTYQADDGESLSNLGTVEIEVLDTEAPTLSWLTPVADGEVLEVGYQMVQLEVAASDNSAIDRVHFFRWDAQDEVFVDIAEVTEASYTVQFHSSELNFEWNQILARVYDTAGNVSESAFIWIYLSVQVEKVFLPSVIR